MEQEKQVQISYRIAKAEIRQFAIFPELLKSNSEVKINANFNYAANVEESTIVCTGTVNYMQGNNTILASQFALHFVLSKETLNAFATAEGWEVPVLFLQHMAQETTVTMRGVLIAKSEGTACAQIILPPFNLGQIITQPFKIQRKDFVINPNQLGQA